MLDALIAHARPERAEDSDALLLHSVYDFPRGIGVDEGSMWGDYFYLEALTRRALPEWERYW
jgi:unsaturated chondroitin disaccharide hydrolase